MRPKIGDPLWSQEEDFTEEQRERLRKLEHEESNNRAKGRICGACYFFKEKKSLPKEGTCLKTRDGNKNESKIFDHNHDCVHY